MVETEELYNATEKATDVSKCPNCGSNLVFEPEQQKLKCLHCQSVIDFNLGERANEVAFESLYSAAPEWKETHVFKCNNCGAKAVLNKTDIAVNCSFCGTSNIIPIDELSGIKPTGVVPFKINNGVASEKVVVWAKKKFFAPKKFKKTVSPEDLKGLYNPAFTFDANSFSSYRGRLGKRYTTTRTVNGKTVTKTETRYFIVSGFYNQIFDEVLVQASTSLGQAIIDKISPFHTNDSKAYTQEYLNGYIASQYTKDGKECYKYAENSMNKTIRSNILRRYHYDVVDYLHVTTNYQNIKYKYLLLPLYVGFCLYNNKNYNFFVNGETGRVAGKAPVSIIKVGILVSIIIALVALIMILYFTMGGN